MESRYTQVIPIFEKEDLKAHRLSNETSNLQTMQNMAIQVVEFWNGGYKIRKIFA
jgi:hypothetical protein